MTETKLNINNINNQESSRLICELFFHKSEVVEDIKSEISNLKVVELDEGFLEVESILISSLDDYYKMIEVISGSRRLDKPDIVGSRIKVFDMKDSYNYMLKIKSKELNNPVYLVCQNDSDFVSMVKRVC